MPRNDLDEREEAVCSAMTELTVVSYMPQDEKQLVLFYDGQPADH